VNDSHKGLFQWIGMREHFLGTLTVFALYFHGQNPWIPVDFPNQSIITQSPLVSVGIEALVAWMPSGEVMNG
jgi:hypothetical protein